MSRLRTALIGAVIVAGGLLTVGGPAQAHNYVVSTIPENGAVLTELPEQFSVTTNDNLLNLGGEGRGFALQIRDADGLYYGDGCVRVEGATMSADAALGAPGSYTIAWQVVSTDGHTASGEIPFTWQPASEAGISTGSPTPPTCGAAEASPAPVATATPTAPADAAEPASAAPWIGLAVVLAGVAVLISLLVVGRRRTPPPAAQ
jgi:copper resistance protein C